jgi:hypothetical protein
MTIQSRIKTVFTLAAVAMAFLAASANAATMSSSITAPDIDSLDIANLNYTGTAKDKWFYNPTTVAGRPKGQTFTTGSDPVKLNAISYQIADNQKAEPIKTYVIRVCTVNRVDPGDSSTWVLTETHSEEATQDFTWNPGTPDTSEFMTWTLDTPVLLEADTEYGIDIVITSTTTDWTTGIPYIKRTGDEYAGGTRYMSGTGGSIGDTTMNKVSGDRIFHIDLSSADPNLPSVDAGIDMITWTGEPVPMDPNIVEKVGSDWMNLTYAWSADPPDGVEFSDPDALAPTVTITKATDNPSVVTLTLAVNNEGRLEPPVTDTMTIDVYDDACEAAIDLGQVAFDPTDFDENCITNFVDFALMATTWLDDYTLTGPVAK